MTQVHKINHNRLDRHLESTDSDSDGLRIAMADTDINLLETDLFGRLGRFTVKFHNGRAVLVVDDLDVMQWRSGTLAANTKGFEDGLLCGPATCEAGLWGWGLLAVSLLFLGEVAGDKGVVIDVDGVDVLHVDADFGAF